MATVNTINKFKSILPGLPTLTATVTSHNVNGTSTLTMTGGGTMIAYGQIVPVNEVALVKGHEIIGKAINLPAFNIDV